MKTSMKLTLLAALGLATACGGGGATAELNLMDAPPTGVTSVKIWVASMQVHVADSGDAKDADPNDTSIDADSKWSTLTVNKQIDLAQKQGESAAEKLGDLDLPAGKITQIRLMIDTSKDDNNTATDAAGTCNLILDKGTLQKGVKINHVFKAFESKSGSKIQSWIDFKLDESLKAKNGCYELKPVLHLEKVKTDGSDTAL